MRFTRTFLVTLLVVTPPLLAAADHAAGEESGPPMARRLLDEVAECAQISTGRYRRDAGGTATVPICGGEGVVHWTADMDIDCDGKRTPECNKRSDCCYQPHTACRQSDGRHLDASSLPFVVLPYPSRLFDYRDWGLGCRTVAAVIYEGKVAYAVVGDIGPSRVIGEASYRAAVNLGIDPDPRTGGAASGVTYILFTGPEARIQVIEDHAQAVALGRRLARRFLSAGR
ncbi:glycoside hydrolase family 75 protein [Rhizohabitans arisaemae]|uniref:glycoside hydrolase family 75 protein n=1 Tax=Rhizohabitans arisaemae TaxID=2720610 RepID=UPI0024B07348|nr:glycoside hydrolase family 75 protein [Rhizohabitans arisaemae]